MLLNWATVFLFIRIFVNRLFFTFFIILSLFDVNIQYIDIVGKNIEKN